MLFSIDLSLLAEQIKATSLLEWIAVSFGVTEVLLARKNNVLLYPAGIIGIMCSGFLLVDAKLYAETLLHAYYLVMSIYGWAMWRNRSASGASQISRSTISEQKITWAIALGGWAFLYFMLTTFTDSDVPIIDAFVSSTAWAGMWLLAKRKLENWIWLNVSNLIAIPLLFHKQLILISFLTIFLFIVAIFAYFDWKKELDQPNAKLKTV
ncbi:nicotinamide riboside transporter PnuC [Algoriphagus aquimarinus]|uniref:Nicotinamide riboside transporter PnuC n=1 Tax=Algoriphagus aquimarinus TaxID=237018 RepID=A0A1I1AJ45_9BACT|nr:nicotinamide riboside transporter PnuC [Algoriphagus aquimarinus]SFB38034.1 nicotinamide mononucleotide transporter [Algoriphagus aquimarinus]|tara:strand:- start:160285 stop:160911 length:627 start_codon:yes stop_codon:yes gene_type:complete